MVVLLTLNVGHSLVIATVHLIGIWLPCSQWVFLVSCVSSVVCSFHEHTLTHAQARTHAAVYKHYIFLAQYTHTHIHPDRHTTTTLPPPPRHTHKHNITYCYHIIMHISTRFHTA